MFADFRRLQGRRTLFFSVSRDALRFLPPARAGGEARVTLVVVPYLMWRQAYPQTPGHEYLVKRVRAAGRLKVCINAVAARRLGLKPGDIVWVQLMPFTENPPRPREPFIQVTRRVHHDTRSRFVYISTTRLSLLRSITRKPNVKVWINGYSFVKRPRSWKITIPAPVRAKKGETVSVRVETTEEQPQSHSRAMTRPALS